MRRPWAIPAAVFLAALLLRGNYFFQIRDHFLFRTPVLDARYYLEWAARIASGDWASRSEGLFRMSPGYPYFLAALQKIGLGSVDAIAWVQFVLGALTAAGIAWLAMRLYSPLLGGVAGLLYAAYLPAIFYEGTLLKAAGIQFLNLSGMVGTFLAARRRSSLAAFFSGLAWSASVQFRPVALLPAVLGGGWAIWYIRKTGGLRWGRAMIAYAVGLCLLILPVALRNLRYGSFALSTAHGGMNLYTGNNPFTLGPYTPLRFARTDPRFEQEDFHAEAERRAARRLTRAEADRFWYGETIRFVTENPGAWLKLLGRKFLILLHDYEPPINLHYDFFRQEVGSVLRWPLFHWGILLPLAAVGLARRLTPEEIWPAAYLAAYALTGILFFVVSEYRLPMVVALCLFAAAGVERIAGWLRKGKEGRRSAWAGAACLVALLWLSNADIYRHLFGLRTYKIAALSNSYFGYGATLEEAGRREEAKAAYRRAIQIQPQSSALVNLAGIHASDGDSAEAERLLAYAVRLDPFSAEARHNYGVLLYEKKRYAEARKMFEEALRIKPYFEESRRALATVNRALSLRSPKEAKRSRR